MSKLIYQEDQVAIDPSRISTEDHETFGPMTVFHDVVIASEMVQEYADGRALKSADELESATWTFEGRWASGGGHPDTPVVMDRDQIAGRTVNLRFRKDLKDPKTERPMRRGIVADLQIFDNKITPDLLTDMKTGKKADVSIGFFFERDETPGTVQDGLLKDEEFDYVQRKIFGDHTAVGIDNGRCPNPLCGLGADEIRDEIVGDPFAGFKNFAACQRQIKKENPKLSAERVDKICGALKAKFEDESKEKDAMRTAKEALLDALKSLEDAEHVEDEKVEWWTMLDWTELREAFDQLDEELQEKIREAGLCPDCQDEEDGECPEGEVWNEEHTECVPADEDDEETEESESEDIPETEETDSIEEKLDAREVLAKATKVLG